MKTTRLSLLLAVALLSHVVFAQEQTSPRFALEISQSGIAHPYLLVPERGESWTFLFARSLFVREPSSFDESRASALKLVYRVEQNAVKITASVYFGRFDTNNTPQSLEGLRQKPVGSFSLKLGESAALQESETSGFESVTIKVATPEQPLKPLIVSNVPSIQVELVSQAQAGYEVAVRNTSARAVLGYSVSSSLADENSGHAVLSRRHGSEPLLISPGAVRQETVYCPPGTRNQPCDYVLQAALFDDGTYEGDPENAARMKARILASDILQRRVQELIDSTMKDTTLDDAGRIAALRERLQALPNTPDKATEQDILKQLQSEFPDLPHQDCSVPGLLTGVLSVFRGEKESLLRSLNDYPDYLQSRNALLAKHPQAKSTTIPLSEWLARHMTMPTTR